MQTSEIYQFHVWLRGISPLIWRRLLLRSDQSVADLHYALQLAFGWSDYHLNRFRIHGKEFGVYHEGGPGFDETPIRSTWRISTSASANDFCISMTSGTAGNIKFDWNESIRLSQSEGIQFVLAGGEPSLPRTAAGLGHFNNAVMKRRGWRRRY